ncbi:Protein IMPACT homolog [Sparassis crispa]|uniref:Protein IMPACT homolog n=1 Tax=Sparassis crispa TaxID=139825 RepID=A0A401GCE8_9APHY|nr:Protein IMPACT homolog [Sparassis crispa]GBE79825.1 Protein IMPACT homolog [Sparassis crispa]
MIPLTLSPSLSSPQYQSIDELVAQLSVDPQCEAIASELGVLQSIYGEDAIQLWHPCTPRERARDEYEQGPRNGEPGSIRYEVALNVSPPSDPSITYPLTILVSLPPAYPASAMPQLQLLSRYVGPYGVDAALFGTVLRTYISKGGVEIVPGEVCVFDGVEWVKEKCAEWVGERMSAVKVEEIMRESEKECLSDIDGEAEQVSKGKAEILMVPTRIPDGVEIVEAEPIVDRKSVFIGRACRITDPSQVEMILAHLMSDRRIARATHPIINAWRCRVGNVLHQDNDDDGESAAGGRLSHLLQILEVDNVLVVVTRYFGGIHLGPDRFKHINQAARNALELGGFLDNGEGSSSTNGRRRGKAGHARR